MQMRFRSGVLVTLLLFAQPGFGADLGTYSANCVGNGTTTSQSISGNVGDTFTVTNTSSAFAACNTVSSAGGYVTFTAGSIAPTANRIFTLSTAGTTDTVTVKNGNGGTVFTVTIAASGIVAPGAPTAVTVTPGNASASVAFTAPSSNGGATITGYTATCISSDGGASGAGTGTSSPISVTGLTNGKTYTCTVKATNSAGDSAASTASATFSPTAPVVQPIPTLTEWMLTLLAALVGIAGHRRLRRRVC